MALGHGQDEIIEETGVIQIVHSTQALKYTRVLIVALPYRATISSCVDRLRVALMKFNNSV